MYLVSRLYSENRRKITCNKTKLLAGNILPIYVSFLLVFVVAGINRRRNIPGKNGKELNLTVNRIDAKYFVNY
jgi:hypothetical protein